MKVKKLGFTLVELLGVIVILGALITIVAISVSSILDKSETKLTKIQIEKIEEAAKNYYVSEGMESSDFEESEFDHCVGINYLIENGYIDQNEISNFETGENMLGSVSISYDSKKYKYTYTENSCHVCEPVTSSTKTTGNIPNGEFLPGDEYICEVKEAVKYHFFVLSVDEDNVNLLMEKNICEDGTTTEAGKTCLMAWYKDEKSTKFGPTTALEYLHNATKDWGNIENIKIDYQDEGNNYGSIKTEENITTISDKAGIFKVTYNSLKARLIEANEATAIGCTSTSCPSWAINYLSGTTSVNQLSGIAGYWTLSSSTSTSGKVVIGTGVASVTANLTNKRGIRPVISVEKDKIYPSDRW